MRGVLVTGAARGIGAAVAQRFAARGDRVAVHYGTSRHDAEALVARLAGDGHFAIGADLTDPEACRALVADAVAGLGSLDVLVCNAGVAPTATNRHVAGEASDHEWDAAWSEMTAVNLVAPAALAHAVAGHLIARGAPGAIVNVGSRGAYRGEPEHPAYAATKAAVHAMGQSLAVSLAPHGISVTSVAPGFISTERQADVLSGERGDALRAQSPWGRVGTPDEVAAAIEWLASPDARWCSGAVLDANGASYLR